MQEYYASYELTNWIFLNCKKTLASNKIHEINNRSIVNLKIPIQRPAWAPHCGLYWDGCGPRLPAPRVLIWAWIYKIMKTLESHTSFKKRRLKMFYCNISFTFKPTKRVTLAAHCLHPPEFKPASYLYELRIDWNRSRLFPKKCSWRVILMCIVKIKAFKHRCKYKYK